MALYKSVIIITLFGAWWLSGKFHALRLEGGRFESRSNHHVGTLGNSSLTIACSASAC